MSRFQDAVRAIKEAQANPVEEFVSTYGEKNASRFDGVKSLMRRGGSMVGKSTLDGLGNAIALSAVAAVAAGGEKAYSAMTRERDFKRMMASNPDLHTDHQNDPRTFNMAFNSLRSMNREFASDPYVAGAYMRAAGPANLQGGSLLAEKVYFPTKKNPNRILDSVLEATAKSHHAMASRPDGPQQWGAHPSSMGGPSGPPSSPSQHRQNMQGGAPQSSSPSAAAQRQRNLNGG